MDKIYFSLTLAVKYSKVYIFIFLAGIILLFFIGVSVFEKRSPKTDSVGQLPGPLIPDTANLSYSGEDSLVRYGKELISSTSKYLGPHGSIAQITNGLNCGNCHLQAGMKFFTNNFFAVASTYPKFRERSGRVESVEFRINECLQRSLNGDPIDSVSKEMKAMVAYVKWTGKNVGKNVTIEGIKTKEVPFLPAAADPAKGAAVYEAKCKACHGVHGEGLLLKDSSGYLYPPLWGGNSYAVSAGMYRITKLASFIKYNMPNGATFQNPQLGDEEAWDVAAYINSQPHPNKTFAYDWPAPGTKPVDYPFGPYTDRFSEMQHKYGPFTDIQKEKNSK